MSDNSNVWRKLRVEEKKRKWIQERETKCKMDFSFISYFNLSKWTMLAPKKMDRRNSTLVTEFVLLGLTDHPDLQSILFVLFLGIYLITVWGNLGMLLLIRIDLHLHTPMYFFFAICPAWVCDIPLTWLPRCWWTYQRENKQTFPILLT